MFNLRLQILVNQLEHLYATTTELELVNGFLGGYSELYDFLITEGHIIDFPPEKKQKMWNLAKQRFNKHRKSWIKPGYETMCKKELEKMYKSFLVRRYLTDRLPKKLTLHYEDGNRVQALNWK